MAVIEAIETIYLEAPAQSVTFSGIPSTYEHLQLRFSVTEEYSAATRSYAQVFLNGSTAHLFTRHIMTGMTSAVGTTLSVLSINATRAVSGGNQPTAGYAGTVMDILDYANTNKNTTLFSTSGWGPLNANGTVALGSSMWDDTAAISTIEIADSPWSAIDFQRGSSFTLYGLNSA
jgi:hypothetical protein